MVDDPHGGRAEISGRARETTSSARGTATGALGLVLRGDIAGLRGQIEQIDREVLFSVLEVVGTSDLHYHSVH